MLLVVYYENLGIVNQDVKITMAYCLVGGVPKSDFLKLL